MSHQVTMKFLLFLCLTACVASSAFAAEETPELELKPCTVELVEGTEVEGKLAVQFDMPDHVIVYSPRLATVRSFLKDRVHALTVDGKRGELNPRCELTAEDKQLLGQIAWPDQPPVEGRKPPDTSETRGAPEQLLVWAKPGKAGRAKNPENWLVNGKPMREWPRAVGDRFQTRYMTTEHGADIHIPVNVSVGSIWVSPPGPSNTSGGANLGGSKHTVFVKRTSHLSACKPMRAIPESFVWTTGKPIIAPAQFANSDWIALKDPSILHHDGRYHLFCTLRGRARSHALVYTSFSDFDEAHEAEPVVLPNHDGYAAAPQVFYFTPHRKWYLICQAAKDGWNPRGQAAYATTDDIANPDSWTPLRPLGLERTKDKYNLDYWVICDGPTAFIFWTSDNGKLWRAQTAKKQFPAGWSKPVLAYQGDIFEAGHIYKAKGRNLFFNLIEARRRGDQRYFKVLYADELDGKWRHLPENSDGVYASVETVEQTDGRWADSISHGEILRDTNNEVLCADLNADFIFQGVLDKERKDRAYGAIPWKLGRLRSTRQQFALSARAP
jgi:hypothetical protein